MKPTLSPIEQIDMIGQLADLKDHLYRQTLLTGALLELLEQKGLLSHQELAARMNVLDVLSHPLVNPTP